MIKKLLLIIIVGMANPLFSMESITEEKLCDVEEELVYDYEKLIYCLTLGNNVPQGMKVPREISNYLAQFVMCDHEVIPFILEKLKEPLVLQGHSKTVIRAKFNETGTKVLTCSQDGTAKIWDACKGTCLKTLKGHTEFLIDGTFSPQGDLVATASSDSTAKIWDVSTDKCLRTLSGHTSNVFSIEFNPEGDKLLTSSVDDTIKIWDLSSGNCLITLPLDAFGRPYFHPTKNIIINCSLESPSSLWDSRTGEHIRTFKDHPRSDSVLFNWSGNKVLIASYDSQSAKLYDTETGNCLKTFSEHNGVYDACFNKKEDQVVTISGHESSIKVWDVSSEKELFTIDIDQGIDKESVAFSTDGKWILAPSKDNVIKIIKSDNGTCLLTLEGHKGSIHSIKWCPITDKVVSASEDTTAMIWDMRKYFSVERYLKHLLTLDQAYLLHCIYTFNQASLKLDFNECPRLQEIYDSLRNEVKELLAPSIIQLGQGNQLFSMAKQFILSKKLYLPLIAAGGFLGYLILQNLNTQDDNFSTK